MIEQPKTRDFDAIRVKLASPEEIRSWSYGEVTKPETINYRTQKPEKDGLFGEEIFGPTKDWECYCGKYKKIRYKGIVCDKCGVEVTHSHVRRERMGHIDLAVPVTHIWFLRGVPSKIGLVLDLSVQNLEKVIYFANFIITDVNEDLKKETIEQLKQEFKSKKKMIDGDFANRSQQAKNEMTKQNKTEKEIDQAVLALAKEKDAKLKDLESESSISEKEIKELKALKIITEDAYHDLSLKYGHLFEAGIGTEAVGRLLKKVDLKKAIVEIDKELPEAQGIKKDKLIRRIKLLKNLEINKINPEWMVLSTIPVIPPDLRPMVPLDGGRFATSDLNDLYRRVINRNNRLKRLVELNAPEVITRNEKRMLQEAVDALIDNSARHAKTTTASTGQKRQLKSIADILKGKQGRFRQNLLGKRIDYSGRSVIVVGPKLRLDQCGLPKRMALELFKPFVISRLIKDGLVHNIRSANRYIELNHLEVWDILEDVTKDAHVLLNRAPTLHRLGIQAFRPVLIEGKAIQVHPLVCTAFNADFDGDQMAVHVPLTEEAKREAREVMLSSKNLLKPATGSPVVTPGKDIVLGVYYMTSIEGADETKIFSSFGEAKIAYHLNKVGLRHKIKVREQLKGKEAAEMVETSVGRILFNQILPEKFPFLNKMVDAKGMGEIVRLSLELYDQEATAKLLDAIKEFGFRYCTKSGYSWGMNDLPVIAGKKTTVEEGDRQIDEINKQYEEGLLTQNERHSRIIEVWTETKDKIVKLSKESLLKTGPVYSMVESGARGSWSQLTQMVGMKGLVSNPAGEIIELPVKANFKEGFDVLEYFISTHGSRKGLSDTALRTANAGYLTRRLVDVSQDMVITINDCEDDRGTLLTKKESDEMGESITNRLLGRTVLQAINDPATGKPIVRKGDIVSEEKLKKIKNIDLQEVKIRSVLTCRAKKGLCQKCYGYDLGYGKLVEFGTAVGIVAAQSIGEPGTQLTMRTFHTGGVAGGSDITRGLPRVEELFEARPPKRKAIMSEVDGRVEKIVAGDRDITLPDGTVITGIRGQKIIQIEHKAVNTEKHEIKKKMQAVIKVKTGAEVAKDEVLYTEEVTLNKEKKTKEVKAGTKGIVNIDKGEDKTILTVTSEGTKITEIIIPPGYPVWAKEGDLLAKGDQLTEGSLDLHELYALKGKEAVQKYITKEIQAIYSSQGQKLNDKHIEIIIRQLFSRVYVKESGDTVLLPGETIEKAELDEANELLGGKGQPAEAEELFLGITKISLSTRSFLSAASFQETSRVLINAAVTGKIDHLEGLKENVIIGRLIPAGSGFKNKEAKEAAKEAKEKEAKAAAKEAKEAAAEA